MHRLTHILYRATHCPVFLGKVFKGCLQQQYLALQFLWLSNNGIYLQERKVYLDVECTKIVNFYAILFATVLLLLFLVVSSHQFVQFECLWFKLQHLCDILGLTIVNGVQSQQGTKTRYVPMVPLQKSRSLFVSLQPICFAHLFLEFIWLLNINTKINSGFIYNLNY